MGVVTGVVAIFAIVMLAGFVLWLWALVEVLKTPDPAYVAAGQSKVVWVLVVVLLGWIGALVYLFVARPPLRRVGAV